MSEVAPHEGKELEMVLNGTKPFAVIEAKKDLIQFHAALNLARNSLLRVIPLQGNEQEVAVFLEGNRSHYEDYIKLIKTSELFIEVEGLANYQREMGRIFGYSKEDIEAFIKSEIKCNCTKCKGMSYGVK